MADANVPEVWSWKKFFSGFVDGRSYAKTIVFLFCACIISTICFSVFYVIKTKFIKKPTPVAQTQSYGTVTGNVTDSHDTKNKDSKSYSLINLLCKN